MEQKNDASLSTNSPSQEPVGIEITLYTDPLCCWSWGMQPQFQELQAEMKLSSSQVKYKMGGLLPSWNHFDDAVNSIRKPIQMGSEWHHAQAVSGRKINDKIWITDPPASSFPACIAVKCAELQSPPLGIQYFNNLQEAVMVKGKNIATTTVLLETALDLATDNPRFNLFRFREDLLGEAGKAGFRRDLQECKYLNITRLPTILFRSADSRSIILTGYQSMESLRNALTKLRKY